MKFIVDNNVGRLTGWLRALGYDTLFINPIDDGRLVDIARREGSRDSGGEGFRGPGGWDVRYLGWRYGSEELQKLEGVGEGACDGVGGVWRHR